MADFTPTQGRYLAFIHAYMQFHGCPPAESDIAAALCVSPPSVNQMVKTLEKRGLPFVDIRGDKDLRERTAIAAVEAVLARAG